MQNSMRLTWTAGALIAVAVLSGCGSAESRKAAYVQHGQKYFATGNYDKARVEYRNAAQIDPKDAEVRYLLGQVAEKTGDVRQAVGQYRGAVEQDPKLSVARAALGRLYVYGGLPDKALELVEVGLAGDPRNAQLLTVRGAARQQLGDAAAALADAKQAVQLSPDDDYAIALLASLYRTDSQLDQAVGVIQAGLLRLPKNVDLHLILADLYSAENQPEEAGAQLRQVVSTEPTVLAHRYRLAQFYLRQKNVDAAEQTLRDAVVAAPADAFAKLQLVEFLAAQRGRDQGAHEAELFIAREPANDDLKLMLGQYFVQSQQFDRAEALFRAVIENAGDKPAGLSARDRLAVLLLGRKDVAGATAQIAEVLKHNPRDNDALSLRADISLASGDAAAAITDLRAVLRDQPNSVGIMRALARAYRQNSESDLAEEVLRSALQIAPKDVDTGLSLAQLLVAANKLDEAAPLLQKLATDNPLNIAIQESLFKVEAGQKRYADARSTAATIERTRPELALGFYLEGLTDEADGKPADAVRSYDQALKLQPSANEPLAALTRLDVQLKQPQKAMQLLDKTITAASKDPYPRTLKAELLASQGQTDAAIAAYQGAVQVAPTWAPAYHGLALAQMAGHRADDAAQTLRQGIEKSGGAQGLIGDLGSLYEREGRPDDAIALYDGVLAKNPKSIYAANNLAMLLVSYKTDAASLTRAQHLADQISASSVVDIVDTRGWVKFKSGDFHGAESLLQQALDKAPDRPEVRYHLAMAQLRSGEQQSAEHNLETALKSARPFVGIDEARAALAQIKKVASAG